MTGEANSQTYTQLVQEVLHQLGRIEGKLDAFDTRLRAVENMSATFIASREEYVPRLKAVEAVLADLSEKVVTTDALDKYKKWLLVTAVPAILGAAWAVLRMWELFQSGGLR